METSEMPNPQYAAYLASRPYFELVREALGDLVDGEHFFDIVAGDVVYEVLYDFPGWANRKKADMTGIRSEQFVRLKQGIPNLFLCRGAVGVVKSTWCSEAFEVE